MQSEQLGKTFEDEALPLLRPLYGYALLLTRDPGESEDLVQEALSKALYAFDSFDPGTNFRAWIFRILRNTFIRSRTSSANAKTVLMSDHPEISDPLDSRSSPEQRLIQIGEETALSSALQKLPPTLRKSLLLHDVEDVKYKDIAFALNVPIGTVMSRISRARATLRETLLSQRTTQTEKSRLDRFFPVVASGRASVLLLSPASDADAPPLDLLRMSTYLSARGYETSLKREYLPQNVPEPHAVCLTSVFSWQIPTVRRLIRETKERWPKAKIILLGVLPRLFGDSIEHDFGVAVLDGRAEAILDRETPDYSLVADWDASILITSKGICPRECDHCETAARGKGVTRLVDNWHRQLNPRLPRVELWDNTLMLTPREHFAKVARVLGNAGKPVDLVCGIMPGGVDERELSWRISQLSDVRFSAIRLECNVVHDLPRFFRLLDHSHKVFGGDVPYRAFAVINGSDSPQLAKQRIKELKAAQLAIDVVPFTPHTWELPYRFANRSTGWSPEVVESMIEECS